MTDKPTLTNAARAPAAHNPNALVALAGDAASPRNPCPEHEVAP